MTRRQIAALQASAGVGVRRFEYGRVRGWMAKIKRAYHGVLLQKLFSDGVYGGPAEALAAATKWRTTMAQALGPAGVRKPRPPRAPRDLPPPVPLWYEDVMNLGTVHRRRKSYVHSVNGRVYDQDFFCAELRCRGYRWQRSFACRKYGVEQAERAAWHQIEWWRKQLKRGQLPDGARRSVSA